MRPESDPEFEKEPTGALDAQGPVFAPYLASLMSKTRITVLVADDHPVVRKGLIALIEHEPDLVVVGEASNGREAMLRFEELAPDVLLMDLRMPEMEGADAVTAIREGHPDAKVIILTTFDGDEDIYRALRAGAKGYLLKDAPPSELIGAVRAVHAGGRSISADAAMKMAERASELDLTEREREVMQLITQGLSNLDIASELSISEGTVKFHVGNIFAKLGVEDRTQAVIVALKRGLVRLG